MRVGLKLGLRVVEEVVGFRCGGLVVWGSGLDVGCAVTRHLLYFFSVRGLGAILFPPPLPFHHYDHRSDRQTVSRAPVLVRSVV